MVYESHAFVLGVVQGFITGGAVLFTAAKNFAQIASNTIPTVTIQATEPLATWTGQPGTFTVYRTGDPTPTLNVYYTISGTASNGVDYQIIGNFLRLTNWDTFNTIVIQPINLGQTDIKTVTLQLAPSPLASPGIPVNYAIGTPRTATGFITPPGVTNTPPIVNITTPTNGANFRPGLVHPVDRGRQRHGRLCDKHGLLRGIESARHRHQRGDRGSAVSAGGFCSRNASLFSDMEQCTRGRVCAHGHGHGQ